MASLLPGRRSEINIYGSADIDSQGSADIDSRFLPAGVGKRSAWWQACCLGGEAKINIYRSADIDSRVFVVAAGQGSGNGVPDQLTLTHRFSGRGWETECLAASLLPGRRSRNKYLRDPLTLTHGFCRHGSGNGVPCGEPAAWAAKRNKYLRIR